MKILRTLPATFLLFLFLGLCTIFCSGAVFTTGASVLAAESTEVAESAEGLVTDANGYLFYYKDGEKQTGWQTINGKTYYFRKTTKNVPYGSAATGLVKIGD
ncbi:MAG: hypothetical protein LUF30_10760 [Lachnospiraceae bacterium]|nr:hypothetical protein [Lachnospiraceae bacterium]